MDHVLIQFKNHIANIPEAWLKPDPKIRLPDYDVLEGFESENWYKWQWGSNVKVRTYMVGILFSQI